jgi:hypothetical protein
MLRFTIRELLILTVTAGLAACWWVEPLFDFNSPKWKSLERETNEKRRATNRRLEPDALRRVPGDKDYQFPPDYPVLYE